ncbi:glycosyltransferase family 4 protein [Minwuia sp.]|uniref:glycosyltransferase family 4 protein n=1 Tax=Minwuia sp. TaxID=2493630 RepID=UPI003A8F05D3
MTRRGHRVIAAAPDIDKATRQGLTDLGAEPHEIRMQRTGLNPLADLALWTRIGALIRRERVDVVFAYTIKPVVWGGLACRTMHNVRFAPMMTGLGYGLTGAPSFRQRMVQGVLSFLLKAALKKAQVVFFQNPDDRALLQDRALLDAEKPTVLTGGSGIDLDRFEAHPIPAQISFLMVARLLKAKGVREYAEAVRRLARDHPAVPCRLIGWLDDSSDSIGEDELAAWQSSGMEFLGFQEDVRPHLAACAVYVLPSYREGTPRSVLEAMATGRAVITTDAPGCRETVNDGENGYLVPVGDADALYNVMVRYIRTPALATEHGHRSRDIAEDRFDVHKVNATILDALDL